MALISFAAIMNVSYLSQKDELSEENVVLTVGIAGPTLCLSVSFGLACKNPIYTEMHGPMLFCCLSILRILLFTVVEFEAK